MQQMLTGALWNDMKEGCFARNCRMNLRCSVAVTIGCKNFKDLAA